MANITRATTRTQALHERTDNTKSDVTKAARKIIGISPITQDDLECLDKPDTTQEDLYANAAREFLTKELKYTDDDCRALEKSADFLRRKAIMINPMYANTDRQRINLKQFIPPQLHARFADLSKHCYNRRQENFDFKTLIKLGEEDLIL